MFNRLLCRLRDHGGENRLKGISIKCFLKRQEEPDSEETETALMNIYLSENI